MPDPAAAARQALKAVMQQELDEPILDYLASLTLVAAAAPQGLARNESLACLVEALQDCCIQHGWNNDSVLASAMLADQVLLHLQRQQVGNVGQVDVSVDAFKEERGVGHGLAACKISSKALRVGAPEFVPQPPAISSKGPLAAGSISLASCSITDGQPRPYGGLTQKLPESEWEANDSEHPSYYNASGGPESCSYSYAPAATSAPGLEPGCDDRCSPEVAAELLEMWFPHYHRAALEQLLEVSGGVLWAAVEDMLLMEGEEPYGSRLGAGGHGQDPQAKLEALMRPAGGATQDSSQVCAPVLTEEEFPCLGQPAGKPSGSGAVSTHGAISWPARQDTGTIGKHSVSVREALLRPRAATAWQRSSGSGWGAVDEFWVEGEEELEEQGSGPAAAFWSVPAPAGGVPSGNKGRGTVLIGSVPVVATGAELTRLYEGAREEAREHAYQRHVCFRKATAAYLSGDRDVAARLSAEARRLGQAMAEADARAASHIFWARNPCVKDPLQMTAANGGSPAFLDLHGLHVKEACSLVASIIKQRRQLAVSGRSGVQLGRLVLCAGAGKHSDPAPPARLKAAADSQGRLAAAVERLLARSGLGYKQLHVGLFEVSG